MIACTKILVLESCTVSKDFYIEHSTPLHIVNYHSNFPSALKSYSLSQKKHPSI